MNQPRVQVRAAAPGDAPALAAILRESTTMAMPWLPVLHTPAEDLAYVSGHLLAGEGHACWVACDDDDDVGFAAVGHGDLVHLHVRPDRQRQGIGSALFDAVAREHPGGFYFWVFTGNTAAQRFYESLGALPLYATDGSANEERMPDVRYRWVPLPR